MFFCNNTIDNARQQDRTTHPRRWFCQGKNIDLMMKEKEKKKKTHRDCLDENKTVTYRGKKYFSFSFIDRQEIVTRAQKRERESEKIQKNVKGFRCCRQLTI